MSHPLSVALAGSTSHTVQIANALADDAHFVIPWVLTPAPKKIGRKQVLTPNRLHDWAAQRQLPVIQVQSKIDADIREQIEVQPSGTPDFLLVVDFGYLVPKWLLDWPKIAPLNIHPSLLPRWRGSSPAQFTLLYGEKNSAVTLMKMGEGLDTGPLIYQLPLVVEPSWTQAEYYHQSFAKMGEVLSEKIAAFAAGTLTPTDQPQNSPTPMARRFEREDGLVGWTDLQAAVEGTSQNFVPQSPTSSLLQDVFAQTRHWPQVVERAIRALSPWPGIWTISPPQQGNKRLKILTAHLTTAGLLQLDKIQWEGEQPSSGENVKF
jgi:methionyl-tRNA formyltransferase